MSDKTTGRPRIHPEALCTACPHLGHKADKSVYSYYATSRNACYRLGKPLAVTETDQELYCLGGHYATCPTFQRSASPAGQQEARPVSVGRLILAWLGR